ncbi:uncharacterized protein V6R79_011608 [Siganus canaliculatus]
MAAPPSSPMWKSNGATALSSTFIPYKNIYHTQHRGDEKKQRRRWERNANGLITCHSTL